jgi:hypothetical protein
VLGNESGPGRDEAVSTYAAARPETPRNEAKNERLCELDGVYLAARGLQLSIQVDEVSCRELEDRQVRS